MLKNLTINNIAVIENAEAVFSLGLNILTGETGAGKSIIVDSINAILGERTSRDLIRKGCDKAKVVATFCDVSDYCKKLFSEYDIDDDGGEYIIQRIISETGKNTCRINGTPVNNKTLKEIGVHLISIHGQHDSQLLLNSDNHCKYLDYFAEDSQELSKYKTAFNNFKNIRKQLKNVIETENALKERYDLLTYQLNELSAADIKVGESQKLKEEITLLENAGKVTDSLKQLTEDGVGESNVIDKLDTVSVLISRNSKYSKDISDISSKLTDIVYELKELKNDAVSVLAALSFDEETVSEKRARLDFLNTLMRKYSSDESGLIKHLQLCKTQLDDIEGNDENRKNLEKMMSDSQSELIAAAEKLTEIRKSASQKLAIEICDVLKLLDMENVRFCVNVEEAPYSQNGRDNVEFLISANKGQSLMPLSKVASGGELSRIMLAIKSVIADKDNVDTLIFDEIDTGISGRAARKVGIQLKKVSNVRQVICITHLAQIAALADNHLLISKTSDSDSTRTSVTPLVGDEQIKELARIMSGTEITDNLFNTAKELLQNNYEV